MKTKKLIIFGDSAFAVIAYEYFTHDSQYEVVAFTVSKEFNNKKKLFNLPIVDFEQIETLYPPTEYCMFIALVYNNLNRIRTLFYNHAKAKGYVLANYISSKSFVWQNVALGDNCFIFEDNTIQPFVKIGNNNIFWSGNHIGHHTCIASNNFFRPMLLFRGFAILIIQIFLG
jgi:acetyltransferase-like isoleucine patch superfamily enzyme